MTPQNTPPHQGGGTWFISAHTLCTHPTPARHKSASPKTPPYIFLTRKINISLARNKKIFMFIETFKLSAPVICQME